jgi:MFS family permease
MASQMKTPSPAEPAPVQQAEGPASPGVARLWRRRTGLWTHADFLKLWGGQSLSLIGTQVTIVAMPLVAVEYLHASASQMGILGALVRAPFVLFLFAGVFADRFRRRPTMIITDLGRGVAIGLIPVLYFMHELSLPWIYGIVLIAGALGVFFEVSNQAFIPSLVDTELVPEANAKFQISQSVAQVGGPSLAGLLVAFFSAASIIVIDAVSYFIGAFASIMIRRPEPPPAAGAQRLKLFPSIAAGVKWVWKQPVVRPMMFATAFYMTFTSGIQALYVFFLHNELHLAAYWIGFTLAFLGVGAIVGSLLSMRSLRRIGPGPSAFWATIVGNGAFLLIVFAGGPKPLAIAMLALAQALIGMTGPVAQVGMGSLRMVLTPNAMQGRVVAAFRGLSLGLAPVGALLGGLLAAAIGLRLTLGILVIGVLVPILIMFFSPIPQTRKFPEPPAEPPAGPTAPEPAGEAG